ncbi:ATP-binding domain-containing protein [Sporosarcina sp. NPDC096371]|uniref:ATP-binding domain-containing protein n=1 Tax=Sporosarcina sp. NPDC096371 TaxID=3364530 RepID=UPI003821112B
MKSKVVLTTPGDAKGLEFDCVIIADLSEYKATDYDRKLAYVATSRALHELYIFHTGSVEYLMGGKD